MKPEIVLAHEFVELVPDKLDERKVYISISYKTVVHLCCCGCGREVVTPLSPAAWQVMFDGMSVSLYPSVGSWSLPCKSHYWIERNKVRWAPHWTQAQIKAGRAAEARTRAEYYGEQPADADPTASLGQHPQGPPPRTAPPGFWGRWWRRLFGS